jgi:hypothetical protein
MLSAGPNLSLSALATPSLCMFSNFPIEQDEELCGRPDRDFVDRGRRRLALTDLSNPVSTKRSEPRLRVPCRMGWSP